MDSGSEHDPTSANGGGRRPRAVKLPAPPPPSGSQPRPKPRLRKLRFALVLLGLTVLAFVSWIFGIMMAVAQDLPSLQSREQYARSENSVVWDINGEKIATLTNNEGRILVESEEIALVMKEAVVAIEDQRFYEHRGVDYRGIARAVVQDITSASAQQGASTITQQFVKNALKAQDSRTVFQKLREAALAYHLERKWSKDEILTEYLNEIYFGEGATGIEAAARTYFGYNHRGCGIGDDAPTCASELYPYEAAMLAGVISSPSAYSPRNYPEAATARRNLVLEKMVEQGYISSEEYELWTTDPEYAIPTGEDIHVPEENSEVPYFTSWLRQQLVDRYGAGEAFGGGLQITSTIDLDLQNAVENAVATRLGGIEPTASVVVLDNDTAAVRAMIGGPDFEKLPFNIATNGHRQPGSAFKPFTLITALEQGHSTSEVFTSAPQEIPFQTRVEGKDGKEKVGSEVFEVNNYEDQYLGSASLLSATTYSDNSVYSQLGTQVGPANVAATAEKMGVETDLSTETEYSIDGGPFEPYNPALILGGLQTGVNTLEMAHAYSTLAADGKRLSGTMAANSGGPVGIYEVRDGDGFGEGDLVPDQTGADGENETIAKQVIDSDVATTVKDVLTTVVTSGTGENAQTGEPTWGKTGTTDDNGDAWFCGATDEITACVWVGHADTVEPMKTEFAGAPVDGGTYPALIFADIVNAYTSLEDARKAGDDPDVEAEEIPAPSTETPPAVDPSETSEPPADVGTDAEGGSGNAIEPAPPAGGDAGGGSAAPSGGGVTPG